MSYRVGHPILVGDTEVIRGTSTASDVAAWPGVLLQHYYGPLWEEAKRLADKFHPRAFVGHSLGAQYAQFLAKVHGGSYRGFGRPGVGPTQPGDVANWGDPVSLLLFGNKQGRWGHSLSSYARSPGGFARPHGA